MFPGAYPPLLVCSAHLSLLWTDTALGGEASCELRQEAWGGRGRWGGFSTIPHLIFKPCSAEVEAICHNITPFILNVNHRIHVYSQTYVSYLYGKQNNVQTIDLADE